MKVSEKLIFILMIGICLISLNANNVIADEQICFKILTPPGLFGEGPVFLQLGIINSGNANMAVSGTAKDYVSPGYDATVGLVHGNAAIANGKVEVALTGSKMSSDISSVFNYYYHLRLDMETLSGTYALTFPVSGEIVRVGSVSVVPCSDWH